VTALLLALYAEGSSDDRFLPSVLQRTAESLLARRQRYAVEVAEPYIVTLPVARRGSADRAGLIAQAARECANFHALIVHSDADGPTRDRAYSERFLPGQQRAAEESGSGRATCQRLVPVIPVRMTEAWMLADLRALLRVIGTDLAPRDLGLPTRPRLVERVPDPKSSLDRLVRRCCPRRRRISVGDLYEPLGRQVDLGKLSQVPAYRQFAEDLTGVLVDLGMAA